MFNLKADFYPSGDQPKAIDDIVRAFNSGAKHHVLLGATGSGKTFTMAHVIAQLGKSALVIAPNKTLAAQLYVELKNLFPTNSVGYFISYYDYYQPEAYVPATDTYIAKDSSINEDIDKMRHESTRYLFEEKQTIIVASVSCIYGLGSPSAYAKMVVNIKTGQNISRDDFLRRLVDIQFSRNDWNLLRGHFRVRGDTVDVLPSHQKDEAIRATFFGDEIESIQLIDALTGKVRRGLEQISIYPNSHYVTAKDDVKSIVKEILTDLGKRLRELKQNNKLVEYQRLEQRTMQDVETLEQLGFCPGIENYSRYLTGLSEGAPPPCLLDYFPQDFLTIIDESHITLPQIAGMYRGDRSRKQTLVDYGFRLPSALDNRPLNYEEFLQKTSQVLYVSATPGPTEQKLADFRYSEQIIRPTGLVDPEIFVKPASIQVDDLYGQMKDVIKRKGRVLITTLTKKMAEDLTEYYREMGIRIKYLHSDIDSLERTALLRSLRKGEFDVLVGINLLREGLDLPEVMLVAVMDADKEGFLRSRTSLIQIVGRAARNHEAKVLFYADKVTRSMQEAIDETNRRRKKQQDYNKIHNIEPKTILKALPEDFKIIHGLLEQTDTSKPKKEEDISLKLKKWGIKTTSDIEKLIGKKKKEMKTLAQKLEFEKAASLRDEIKELAGLALVYGEH